MSKRPSMLIAAALLASAVFATRPARAAYCGATAIPGYPTYTCSLKSNAANHFIHVSMTPFVVARLIDVHKDVVVYRGAAGIWGIEKTVTGLYDLYYGAVGPGNNVAGQIIISNS
jgi:hypothetical protein